MTASQENWKQEQWYKTRDSGLPRFLLLKGVLQFGLPLLVFMELFASPSFFDTFNIPNFALNVVSSVVGGTVAGLFCWQYYRYRYGKND